MPLSFWASFRGHSSTTSTAAKPSFTIRWTSSQSLPATSIVAKDEVRLGQPLQRAGAGAQGLVQRPGLADPGRACESDAGAFLRKVIDETASQLREVEGVARLLTDGELSVRAVHEGRPDDIGPFAPLGEGGKTRERNLRLFLYPERDGRMHARPGSKLIAVVDFHCVEPAWIAAGNFDALADCLGAVFQLVADKRCGRDADVAAASIQDRLDRLVQSLLALGFGAL